MNSKVQKLLVDIHYVVKYFCYLVYVGFEIFIGYNK